MRTPESYDLVVIGAGSGGVRAARIASGHGAKVAICESDRVGGTCVLRGCIPKKFLVYAAHYQESFADAAAYGWTVDGARHDWGALIRAKDAELDRLNGIYCRLLDEAGVVTVMGRAILLDPHTVQVGGRLLRADRIIVAVGGWPSVPPFPGNDLAITSNEALSLAERPDRVLIIGGGYIAVEFAGIFNGVGSEVVLAYRREQILRGFDGDVRAAITEELRAHGVDVQVGLAPERIRRTGDGLQTTMGDGSTFLGDQVLVATGRAPNTADLGLEEAGVELAQDGSVIVNDQLATSVPHIYAIGDVTNLLNLTPVATAQGHALADTLFGGSARSVDLSAVPSAVFSQPPIATVGWTEEKARASGRPIDVYRTSFRALLHTLTGRDSKVMMKLVVDREDGRILGAHMVGDDAPEIMQMVGVAIRAGATKADFDATIGIHPTTAEEFVTLRTPVAEKEGAFAG
ncbi:MAG: glutathione-disulfide reductase [Rhodospirillales bacterium]|nr:glutathione-disulfide reductase [Rhodospirillales bacterium]